ncbi:hypothetical protein JHK82_026260 [Glycine max]|nr:hypothetical protein JHK85_026878 [Glycine max]KAG5014125.1 hypothetical protein JHK86_026386 [Glycine max]KAG5135072.1 hypothetical protein JHK82_026260 [Glycine max]
MEESKTSFSLFKKPLSWQNTCYLLRPPTTTLTPPISTKSTPSSATDGDPMQVEIVADDEETTSKCTIDKVEEKMRHCFIKNKRPKRPLLPSAAAVAEEKRVVSDDGFVGRVSDSDYDPYAMRLRALDLIYQMVGFVDGHGLWLFWHGRFGM